MGVNNLVFDGQIRAERIRRVLPAVAELTSPCRLCGRRCGARRALGEVGVCRAATGPALHARYSSATLHFGEEPMLVGTGGSGTVFFTHCNLRCVFCQNHQISQQGLGERIAPAELARLFLELRRRGAENINLVTPTHYMHPILAALAEAFDAGLDCPIVYNTNGFDAVELIELLEGLVDVYLPDMKYMETAHAAKYSGAGGYPEAAKAALRAMYGQAGILDVVGGVARRGVILRHLVLPNHVASTYDLLLWLKDEGMHEITLSLMSQYAPRHRAQEYPEIAAPLDPKEYAALVEYAVDLGFTHLLAQACESHRLYLPDFEQEEPFAREEA